MRRASGSRPARSPSSSGRREGETEGDGLARTGLGGDDQVAAMRLFLDDRRLDRGKRV